MGWNTKHYQVSHLFLGGGWSQCAVAVVLLIRNHRVDRDLQLFRGAEAHTNTVFTEVKTK